jgi:hypothetical protein
MHVAAENGHTRVLQLLLEGGFDPFTPAASQGALTAIHFAVRCLQNAAIYEYDFHSDYHSFALTFFSSMGMFSYLQAAKGHTDTVAVSNTGCRSLST